MDTNLTKYKDDLKKLISEGGYLYNSLFLSCENDKLVEIYNDNEKKELSKFISLFKNEYEIWYSESLQLIKQILPTRLDDFIGFYKNPLRNSNQIDYATYTISDYLIGLGVSKDGNRIVGNANDVLSKFKQQFNILKSVEKRFESSLFDIKQLVQADVFDDELESAKELLKNGFTRASGAICGVVLEKHLKEVLINHDPDIKNEFKKKPCINDLNNLLKSKSIIDVPTWRNIQYLGDIRNLCDHSGDREPKDEEINALIEGVKKITKTLF